MPSARSLLSSSALPPVSAASAYSVSCDRWKLVVIASAELPVYMPLPPGDPWSHRPAEPGHQAARVDRPEGDAGANRGVDGGMQLRLIVHAVQPDSAGEIQQRLLLVELPQHLHRGLQRRQLPIGIEDVELAVVLPEGGAGVGGAVVAGGFVKPCSSPTTMVSMMV